MTAPDSRDSVAIEFFHEADKLASSLAGIPFGPTRTALESEIVTLRRCALRLQALARGPQQAGGEDAVQAAARIASEAACLRIDNERLQAEVARLQRERAELIDKLNGTPCAEVRWQQERERLQAALLEAGRDAERWRFLTSMDVGEYIGLVEYNNPDELAHAIDAVRLVRDGDSGEG